MASRTAQNMPFWVLLSGALVWTILVAALAHG
jgi:hypothetical protein